MSLVITANPPPSTPSKEAQTSMAEIKNNKIVFKQKPMSLDKQSETLQEIVQFRSMLQGRVSNSEGPLNVIPTTYQPVIAKLAFESDKTLSTLAKHIHHELLPIHDEDSPSSAYVLPLAAVEAVIKAAMVRTNYGIDPPPGTKLPASLSVWRWEVNKECTDWLPPNIRPKATARLAERTEAKKLLNEIFAKLSPAERDTLGGSKGVTHNKTLLKNNVANDPSTSKAEQSDGQKPDKVKAGRVKTEKVSDLKEIERMERKAAKAEKERKEKDAQNKSRSLMATFFAKGHRSTQSESKVEAPPTQTDFERTFKPFVLKKDATMASCNIFREKPIPLASGTADDVIIVEDDVHYPTRNRRMSAPLLGDQESVRELVTQLSEAEVTDDTNTVRAILAKLADRSLLPAKVFIFKDDARPGYYGTWTRTSSAINPRRPFGKDVLQVDYGYDSGEEWEEEPIGEADDVVEEDDDDGDGGDDADSDMESWLVDDDQEDGPVSLDQMDLDIPRPSKRKTDDADKNLSKKRRVVVPLVPFAKGPIWEPSIGQCTYEPFNAYRIRLMTDTSLPIDPFNHVNAPRVEQKAKGNPPSSEVVFAVPPLPAKVDLSQLPAPSASSVMQAPAFIAKRPTPVAKSAFPDAHLQTLIDKLCSVQTGSLAFLVESIHQDLQTHKVKKNAIEAKVREIGEKCKETKRWRLKAEFIPPSGSLSA